MMRPEKIGKEIFGYMRDLPSGWRRKKNLMLCYTYLKSAADKKPRSSIGL